MLGGIHASMMSEEAARHVDSIVLGEGEAVWPVVLRDFEEGTLQKIYRGQRPDLRGQVAPRRELLQKDYFVQTVQTSRGCPFNCEFCSVTQSNGGKYRFRPVRDIITEVDRLNDSRFFFIDDNIVGSNREAVDRSLELFGELEPLDKVWGSQVCIDIVEHDEVLRAAADSHASFFFVGFESLESEALSSMNKKINLRPGTRNFKEAIRKIHDHGIAVVGGFMFGNDCETRDVFEKTVEFVVESRIDAAQFSIQTPFPGTRLYQRLESENRLLYTDYPRDWARYNGFEVVFEPRNMTADELKEGQIWAYRQVASFGRSVLRAARTLVTTRSLTGTAVAFCWNYDCYRSIAGSSVTSG